MFRVVSRLSPVAWNSRLVLLVVLVLSLCGTLAWYVTDDYATYLWMAPQMSCFDPVDCMYSFNENEFLLIAAAICSAAALMAIWGARLATLLFPLVGAMVLATLPEMMRGSLSFRNTWEVFAVISYLSLALVLAVPFAKSLLRRREQLVTSASGT